MIVRTNGLAIASMVMSIASVFLGVFFVPEILGIVFGHIAMSQIKQSRDNQRGSGMAVAGLVIGYLVLVFWIVIVIVAATSSNDTNY
jgi:ABC-type spermidine/putrescine transport system permease subunit I